MTGTTAQRIEGRCIYILPARPALSPPAPQPRRPGSFLAPSRSGAPRCDFKKAAFRLSRRTADARTPRFRGCGSTGWRRGHASLAVHPERGDHGFVPSFLDSLPPAAAAVSTTTIASQCASADAPTAGDHRGAAREPDPAALGRRKGARGSPSDKLTSGPPGCCRKQAAAEWDAA
jgi:hypothetical protein